jgi:hypothetical protein
MKTLIIFNDIESPLQYLIVDGDYTRFNGIFVNSVNENGYEDEFCDWMFDKETGEYNLEWSSDKSLIEDKQWDKVAICTWLP